MVCMVCTSKAAAGDCLTFSASFLRQHRAAHATRAAITHTLSRFAFFGNEHSNIQKDTINKKCKRFRCELRQQFRSRGSPSVFRVGVRSHLLVREGPLDLLHCTRCRTLWPRDVVGCGGQVDGTAW